MVEGSAWLRFRRQLGWLGSGMLPSRRTLVLPLLILAAAMPAAEKKPTLVWDGDGANVGAGWAKAGGDKPAAFTVEAGDAASKNVARLHAEGDHWVRAGWRWVKSDSKVGFNAKPFAAFCFAIKGDKVQTMPTDIKVILVASAADGTRVEGPEVSLATAAPKALGGGKAWVQVVLPVKDLTAAKDFDATNITEVMFVATGGKGIDADLLIDNIGFIKGK
jgi:hypothetical protein